MTRTELVNAIAEYTGEPKNRTKIIILGMIDVIIDTLKKGEEVNISDFMKFAIVDVKPKRYINRFIEKPKNCVKPGYKKVKPVPFAALRDCLKEGE